MLRVTYGMMQDDEDFNGSPFIKLVLMGKEKNMRWGSQVRLKTLVCGWMMVLAVILSFAKADEKQWMILHENIPQDKKRIPVKLEFASSTIPFFQSQSVYKSERLQEDKDGYQQQLDLGTGIDGKQYVVFLKDASDLNVIHENPERLSMVKAIRVAGNQEMEIIREGLMFLNREVVIPFDLAPKKIGISSKEPIKGSFRICIYHGACPQYEGRCQATLNGSLSGSTSVETAMICASIVCGDSLELKNRNLSLTVKPFSDRMASVTSAGKISDILMLGSAKFVVEKIAFNSSELVLALLDGQLVQERLQEDAYPVVGNSFPAFTRVDLFRHELVALDNLLNQAGEGGYVVLVFGDFKATPLPYYGGQPPMRNLSLDERVISNIVKKDCDKSVVIGFICQQFPLGYLYEKWLGQDPELHVLSDFSNPMDMQFVGVRAEPGMFRSDERGETLRRNLKLENQKIITALIDGNGGLIYLNPDAGSELSKSLVEINRLMKEGVTAEKR